MMTTFAENETTQRAENSSTKTVESLALPAQPGRILSSAELDQAMRKARVERSRAFWHMAAAVKRGVVYLYREFVRYRTLSRTMAAVRKLPPHLRSDIGIRESDMWRTKDLENLAIGPNDRCSACR
jgi:uncharacterized protein YjiS (DUF1127 family)